jgi:hypothetical protein
MLILASTSDKLQVVTDAVTPVGVHASFMDYDGTTTTPGRKNTLISSATTTDIVAQPGSGVRRTVKTLHIRNTHGSSSVLITLQHTDGATVVQLEKLTLLAGEQLAYTEGRGISLYDANGLIR